MAGLDYDHGTGHGVGSYLSVHEGPARINKTDRTPLEPGMILSNEPGFYKQDHFGIRIENLFLVREPEAIEGGERPMMWFETLTLCPIERRLDRQPILLAKDEAAVAQRLSRPRLQGGGRSPVGAELDWLKSLRARSIEDAWLGGLAHARTSRRRLMIVTTAAGAKKAAPAVIAAATVSATPVAKIVGAMTAIRMAGGSASSAALSLALHRDAAHQIEPADPRGIGRKRHAENRQNVSVIELHALLSIKHAATTTPNEPPITMYQAPGT